MKKLRADNFLGRCLARLAAAVVRHPHAFFWPQVALFLGCAVYTVLFLKTDMDRDNLVGPNLKYHQNYLALQKEFPQPSDIVVVVESDNLEKNRQFVERIAAKMQAETNLFQDIFYQQSLSVMGRKALRFADKTNLVEIQTRLHAAGPFIRQFTTTTNLVSLFEAINTAFRTAPHEENAETRSLVGSLPSLTRIVSQARAALERSGAPPSPNVISFLGKDESDLLSGYITFAHGKMFLVTTHAPLAATVGDTLDRAHPNRRWTQADVDSLAIERLDEIVKATQAEVPGLNVGLTGESVLDYYETLQSTKDVTLASIVSLVLCLLIFIYGYNETGRPIKATICLVIGMGYTMAFTTLAIGHLNILTVTFAPMLIGLAIDFGVHLITRYEEELRHGKTEVEALTKAMVFTGQGIFTGALTTAGAFLAMSLTHFKGIQEMGIICGGGLMLCLVPMLTMLPTMLLRGKQNRLDHFVHEDERRARIEKIWLERPWAVMGVTLALCLCAGFAGRKLYFDYNLIEMQSPRLPSVVFEQKLFASAGKSLLLGLVTADSLTNAVAMQEKIEALPGVAETQPPFYKNFLDPNPEAKLQLIGAIKAEVATLKFAPPDTRPVDVLALSRTLYGLNGYLGNALVEISTNDPALTQQIAALRETIVDLRKAALAGDDAAIARHGEKLAQFQRALLDDLRGTFELLQQQDNASPLRVEDLPPALRHRFVGVNGKFLIQIYPKEDVWQRAPQEKFVAALRTIDPNVTGTPVQLLEYETLLKDSYVQAAWYSLGAIALMVFFHFRSVGAVILSLLPVALGTLWLAGLMGWQNVAVNLANIMTLPLVIGIGVTNGIHILNRYAEEGTPGILSRSTGKAVLVSGLTAIAGFGSLILAQHRGIHSLGIIMSVGIATCMIAGLTFLPALLNLLGGSKRRNKKTEADSSSPAPGQAEPR